LLKSGCLSVFADIVQRNLIGLSLKEAELKKSSGAERTGPEGKVPGKKEYP